MQNYYATTKPIGLSSVLQIVIRFGKKTTLGLKLAVHENRVRQKTQLARFTANNVFDLILLFD